MPRRQTPRRRSRPTGNVLLIPDLHCEYQHPDAFEFLAKLRAEFKPTRTVILGDVIDGLAASRYDTPAAADGADEEWRKTKIALIELADIFPDVDIVTGNHDVRVEKKASTVGIPADRIRPIQEVPDLRKPLAGWRWHEMFDINADTVALHGDGLGGANPGEVAVLTHRKNVVIGHLHTRFGVNYYSRGNWRNWCLHVGCLIDTNSVANAYAKHHTKKPILGAGVLLDGRIPLPVPMP